MVLRGRKTSKPDSQEDLQRLNPPRPKKRSPSLYQCWIIFCLVVLIGFAVGFLRLIQNTRNLDDDYNYVRSDSLSEEQRKNWNPDAIRQNHELKYKQNRTVCVDRTEAGECAPIWCDDHRQASWTGTVIRPTDTRGLHSLVMSMSQAGKEPEDHHFHECAVSDDYHFIFLHVPRSGGTTIKTLLKKGMCDGGSFDESKLSCSETAGGKRRLHFQDCAEAISAHDAYKVFSFVRSPYSRWLSSYTMGAAFAKSQTKQFPLSFEAFLNNPQDLLKYSTKEINPMHWLSQMNFILDRQGCPAVDFIGHLEMIEQDLAAVLDLIGRPPPLMLFLKDNGHLFSEKSASYRKQAKNKGSISEESALSETAIALIQQRSISEIALLGYGSHYPFI